MSNSNFNTGTCGYAVNPDTDRMNVDYERLEAYEKILKNTKEDPFAHMRTHKVTQPVRVDVKTAIAQAKERFTAYLMQRKLDYDGDL